MSAEDVIVSFLKKEELIKGDVKSTGYKLIVSDTCIAQWENHHVLYTNSFINAKIEKIQNALVKWLKSSMILSQVITDVPEGTKSLIELR